MIFDKNKNNKFAPRALSIPKHPTVGALAGQSSCIFQLPLTPRPTKNSKSVHNCRRTYLRTKTWRYRRENAYLPVKSSIADNEEDYSAIVKSPFVSKRNKLRRKRAKMRQGLSRNFSQDHHPIQDNPTLSNSGTKSNEERGNRQNCQSNPTTAAASSKDAVHILLGIVSGGKPVETNVSKSKKCVDASTCQIHDKCYCEDCFNIQSEWADTDPQKAPTRTSQVSSESKSERFPMNC